MVNFTEKLAAAVRDFEVVPAPAFVDYAKLRHIIEGYASNDGWTSDFLSAYEAEVKSKVIFEGRSTFIPSDELDRYVQLNKTGLDKIAKKYDKIVAYLQVSAKLQGKDFTAAVDHLRNSNAILFISEFEPLAASSMAKKTRMWQWMKVLICSCAIAITAVSVAISHSRKSMISDSPDVLYFDLPWHAYVILALGWPISVGAWFAGNSGIAPGSPILVIVILIVTAISYLLLVGSKAPAFPESPAGWSWWIFFLLHLWPMPWQYTVSSRAVQILQRSRENPSP